MASGKSVHTPVDPCESDFEPDPVTLRIVAWKRYADGMSWPAIAKDVGHNRKTLYNWRQCGAPWQEACLQAVAIMREEGQKEAWGCLIRQAHHGDVAAAREILNRLEGVVSQ